ncbi:hypothetical protein [Anaerospora hongkongensis]|uniref:hypothetical protein n=1 Tax=Anaerospora hongkongensis TaxID=244830 RepID=UPI002FDB29F2
MIGIYMGENETQIVKAQIKDNSLKIDFCNVIDSYMDSLKQCDVHFLIDMFQQIKQEAGAFYEEFYIALPDTIFLSIDCYESRTEEEKIAIIEARLNRSREGLYLSNPIEMKSGARHKETMAVIDRSIIDCLIAAAKAADIALLSVEPASFAYLKCAGQWRKEHYLLESFRDEAAIIAYSPVAGMFRLSVPQLAGNQDLDKQTLEGTLARCDAVAEKTFEIMNTDMPLTILDAPGLTVMDRSVIERLAEKAVFPDFIKSQLGPIQQQQFCLAVGTLLQDSALDIYSTVPECLSIRMANLLPASVRSESRLQQIKRITRKFSKALCLLLGICLLLEVAGIFFYASFTIPEALQQQYDQAQSQLPAIKKEMDIIKLSKSEHQYPIEALQALLKEQPQTMHFSSIEIGKKGVTSGSEGDKKWITFTAKGPDPIIFRDYSVQLREQAIFRGVDVSMISTDSSGLKSATVYIGKGIVR